MIDEYALQEAICRGFTGLFPDLSVQGFRVRAREAVLLGRRLDIVLSSDANETIIMELKQGSPPMPAVRDQILDYKQCWMLSYPAAPAPRVMVVANSVSSAAADELENFGIESRAITEHLIVQILAACGSSDVVKGLRLLPDDTSRVRHLLSDYDTISKPEGLLLRGPWNHEKVFLALVERGEKYKDLWKKDIYVQICAQKANCAVLYGPKVRRYAPGFLHLNPRASSWRRQILDSVAPALKYRHTDAKGAGKESSNFDHYEVRDWDMFARGLGLPP